MRSYETEVRQSKRDEVNQGSNTTRDVKEGRVLGPVISTRGGGGWVGTNQGSETRGADENIHKTKKKTVGVIYRECINLCHWVRDPDAEWRGSLGKG